jgi:hypothetical protein
MQVLENGVIDKATLLSLCLFALRNSVLQMEAAYYSEISVSVYETV